MPEAFEKPFNGFGPDCSLHTTGSKQFRMCITNSYFVAENKNVKNNLQLNPKKRIGTSKYVVIYV